MVSNQLTYNEVLEKAEQLDFPSSVLEFFEGLMGQPYGGFPEPLRSQALRGRRKMTKRPGLYLEPMDFDGIRKKLKEQFGSNSETDVASYAMYPKVFEDYKKWTSKFGDLSVLPTKYFLAKPEIGEEFNVELEKGKVLILKLLAIGPLSEQTGQREVFYEMNGEVRQVTVDDNHAAVENKSRPKADAGDSSQVGAPMSGVVVEVRVKQGGDVNKGDPIAVLSAMKMVSLLDGTDSEVDDVLTWYRRKWSSRRHTLVRLMVWLSRRATLSIAPTSSARSSSRPLRVLNITCIFFLSYISTFRVSVASHKHI